VVEWGGVGSGVYVGGVGGWGGEGGGGYAVGFYLFVCRNSFGTSQQRRFWPRPRRGRRV
jgi:hypothetical protein